MNIKQKLAAVVAAAMIVSSTACGEVKKGSESTSTTSPTSGEVPTATAKVEATPGITPYETLPGTPEETIALSTNSTPDICGTSTVTSNIKPTIDPSATPSATPMVKPTSSPTSTPTVIPTEKPTEQVTEKITDKPIVTQSATITIKPTATPTVTPTVKPTATVKPTSTATPTVTPTEKPTATPNERHTITKGLIAGRRLGMDEFRNTTDFYGSLIGLFKQNETVFTEKTALRAMVIKESERTFYFTDLEFGTYIIREIIAPNGQELITKSYEVTLDAQHGYVYIDIKPDKPTEKPTEYNQIVQLCEKYASAWGMRGFSFLYYDKLTYETAKHEGIVKVGEYDSVEQIVEQLKKHMDAIPYIVLETHVRKSAVSYKIAKVDINGEAAYTVLYSEVVEPPRRPDLYYPENTEYRPLMEYWVKYTEDYARSLGMEVWKFTPTEDDPGSWDAPINITPSFGCFDDMRFVKDIEHRLDNYSKGISLMGKPLTSTAIWYEWNTEWARYELYIWR